MRTEEEVRKRIEGIENMQKNGLQDGYIPIKDVRNILINNFLWVLGGDNVKMGS